MGVDWIRMRPKPGVSRDVLAELTQAQAAAFLATDSWYRRPPRLGGAGGH
jgi:hypothetical protein